MSDDNHFGPSFVENRGLAESRLRVDLTRIGTAMVTRATHEEGFTSCPCCQPALRNAERRITGELTRRGMLAGAASVIAGLGTASRTQAAAQPPIVFTNSQLFDGTSSSLRGGLHLLIEAGRIKEVASGAPGSPEGPPACAVDYIC